MCEDNKSGMSQPSLPSQRSLTLGKCFTGPVDLWYSRFAFRFKCTIALSNWDVDYV